MEKTPCTSTSAPAIAVGRYADAQRGTGFATVTPTPGWRTSRAFVRENAEFVVVLYGAVWAAPRHTFATVLARPLPGVSGFRFSWYVCGGAWEQAREFARRVGR